MHAFRAITLDLDDTLWPVAPAIAGAEAALHAWFEAHAPEVARRHDPAAVRAFCLQEAVDRPDRAHDHTHLRRHGIGRALADCGHPPHLVDPAFEAYFQARNRVDLFADVPQALARLAARYPLLAVTNGNADLALTGVAHHFVGSVSARSCGIAKPDPRIFAEACRQLGLAPAQVLHVGDDWALDVEGARAAGLLAVWLQRPPVPARSGPVPDSVWVCAHLGELADRLLPQGRQ